MHMMRAHYPAGFRVQPARHADHRVATVLAGTLYVGFGERFEENRLVAVPKGATWTIPARQPYYLWAKEGAVLLQVMGND
ncbi:cupin domain-containing protein [Ramlibacter ginsenosidimutans]|uniref:Cupin domain-containing protein n=1 Tax=Ramlibacter ginsenosidimutans TaxID=502333 RepID=A0A934TQ01_9BURK|nr:cupin domain-containing protein [Ramlibacter ginsenosidimutans]MBK6005145.1 cupin domain-containing protein [Ramlibacter ginsenosidimutans]